MSWVWSDDRWLHRPWWKVAINTALRFVQTRARPRHILVIATICDVEREDREHPPRVLGYRLRRVLHLPDPPLKIL